MIETHVGLVSLIMPTYNRAQKFLDRAIQHAIEQTYDKWELIIVDDGSTDDTGDAVRCYQSDPRIKYVKLDNNSGCVSIPRAIGILHAKGEFIAHWDDDIVHYPRKLEALVAPMNEDFELMLVHGLRRAERMHDLGHYDLVGSPNYDPTVTWGVDGSQFIYRSDVYRKIPMSFCKRGCDWELMKLIWEEFPNSFKMIDELVSQYDWHGGNRSLDDAGTKGRAYFPIHYRRYFDELGQHFTYSLGAF